MTFSTSIPTLLSFLFFLSLLSPLSAQEKARPGELRRALLQPDQSELEKSLLPKMGIHLPFFCQIEKNIENKTQLPIKIRLGEAQAVERLEGKGVESWKRRVVQARKDDADPSPQSGG